MSTGIQLIAKERQRQISKEGWTPEHDDEHRDMELNYAAQAYLIAAQQIRIHSELSGRKPDFAFIAEMNWPWDARWWKPSDDPVRNLIKAGALIAAEIDRLEREALRAKLGGPITECPVCRGAGGVHVEAGDHFSFWKCETCDGDRFVAKSVPC